MLVYDTISIDFTLTFKCNYFCKYCVQNTSKGNKKLIPYRKLQKITEILFDEIIKNDIKFFNMTVMGGELSVLQETKEHLEVLINFCKRLQDHGLKGEFGFLTNFSGPLEYFLDIDKLASDSKLKEIRFFWYLSMHRKYVENDTKEIIQKIDAFSNQSAKDHNIYVNFMIDGDQLLIQDDYRKEFNVLFEKDNVDKSETPIRWEDSNDETKWFENKNYLKRCDALAYWVDPEGIIRDYCRFSVQPMTEFKIIKKEIRCDMVCPCGDDIFTEIFNQIPEKTEKE